MIENRCVVGAALLAYRRNLYHVNYTSHTHERMAREAQTRIHHRRNVRDETAVRFSTTNKQVGRNPEARVGIVRKSPVFHRMQPGHVP